MKVSIQASNVVLTPEDIEGAIPGEVMTRIKRGDLHPLFQAYSIAQEGISRPRVIGQGQMAISWPRSAVSSLAGLVKRGLQFFMGHNSDNSTEGRKAIGEVVADFQTTIRGILNHIVIGYFPDKAAARNCDVCSIEANVSLRETAGGLIADAVESITGIALGNSSNENPAFAGAVRLGALQAFDGAGDENKNKGAQKMEITLQDIVEGVRKLNVWPHQIYDETAMNADRVFGPMLAERKAMADKAAGLEKTVQEKEKEIATVRRSAEKVTAAGKLAARLPSGLTEKQKEFIVKRFDPEKVEDLSDTGIDTFISNSQKEYTEMAKLFSPNDTGTGTGGKPPGNTGGDGTGMDPVDPVDALVNAIAK